MIERMFGDLAISASDSSIPPDLIIDESGRDLAVWSGIESAILLSYFTDKRITPELASQLGISKSSYMGGWWGDEFSESPYGSYLWLLRYEKKADQIIEKAKKYCLESVKWMVEAGVISSVKPGALLRGSTLEISTTITLSNSDNKTMKFFYNWKELGA